MNINMITLFLCLLLFAIMVYIVDKSSKPPTVGIERKKRVNIMRKEELTKEEAIEFGKTILKLSNGVPNDHTYQFTKLAVNALEYELYNKRTNSNKEIKLLLHLIILELAFVIAGIGCIIL